MNITSLIQEHFKENKKFNIDEYLRQNVGEEHKKNYDLDCFDICDILPTAKVVAVYDNYNICYHGRECGAFTLRLYKYKNYYIVYSFDAEGDDLEVLSFKHTYNDVIDMFYDATTITVYSKKDFDHEKFLDTKYSEGYDEHENNLDFVINIYKCVYPGNWFAKFNKYIKKKYFLI